MWWFSIAMTNNQRLLIHFGSMLDWVKFLWTLKERAMVLWMEIPTSASKLQVVRLLRSHKPLNHPKPQRWELSTMVYQFLSHLRVRSPAAGPPESPWVSRPFGLGRLEPQTLKKWNPEKGWKWRICRSVILLFFPHEDHLPKISVLPLCSCQMW